MDSDWEWVYDLIEKPPKLSPELPEDIWVMFVRKNPMVQELIDKFSLELDI